MATKSLFMESTEVSAERTASQIVDELARAGASQINMEYDKGTVTGLRWVMPLAGSDVVFAMPVRVDPIFKILRSRNRNTWMSDAEKEKMSAKSRRVAWRQLLRWVQAQMAMIDCGMVKAQEVFSPYMQVPSGQSLFELIESRGMLALPAPSDVR